MTTSPIVTLPEYTNRISTRRQERRMLARSLRRRNLARRFDTLVYTYQGTISVLAITGAAAMIITALGVILKVVTL